MQAAVSPRCPQRLLPVDPVGDLPEGSGSQQDEELFRVLSEDLANRIEATLAPWTISNIERLSSAAGISLTDEQRSAVEAAAQQCQLEVGARVRDLLAADIDDQRTTPLVLLRDGAAFATALLAELGVPEVVRDEFERRSFPNDIYGLSPASLADVDQSLAEPGMIWGAAKAHLYKRRRIS